MDYVVVYDRHDRLRVRCGDYAFTPEQAAGIAVRLNTCAFVLEASANWRSGGILVRYRPGARHAVLEMIAGLDADGIPESEVPPLAAADDRFQSKLLTMVSIRVLMRFVPAPIGYAVITVKAVRYVLKGLNSLLDAKLDVAVLDATSVAVSLLTGNFGTAGSIMFLLDLSQLLEEHTHERTKLALTEQLALHVDAVWLRTDAEPALVPYRSVQVGDAVIIGEGSVIPFDGEVAEGEAMVNQSTMTGEAEPVLRREGDSVFAGTTVEAGRIVVTVTSSPDGTRLQRIIDMIDESETLKASIQSDAEHLADRIVPYNFLGFALAWLITGNLSKALSVLMVDYSCAIKLTTPISVISAMREAAERGITVKGGKHLESFAHADTVVFDKTGTLTTASPRVVDVVPFNRFSRSYVLKMAACLEEHFPHSVALAVVNRAKEENLAHEEEHAEVEYLVAHGIATRLGDQRAIIGSAHFVFEDEGISPTRRQQSVIAAQAAGNSAIFLAIGGKLAGMIVIDDPVRDEAAGVLADLRGTGIDRLCMLTGDAESAAQRIAEHLSLDAHVAQMLPEYKSEYVKALQAEGRTVIMVGDGINDAPALAAADVSVAMSDGSDLAREVADITLRNDRLSELVTLRVLSERLLERIAASYRFIVGFNTGLIALGLAGVLPPTISAVLHNGSTMLISARSMTKLLPPDPGTLPGSGA